MKKRKAKVIKDPKVRGEWAESVFMARAGEHGLAVSKPWGDSKTYDFVIGRPGRFVSVQVKSTMAEFKGGYVCTVRRHHGHYVTGAFDFLAVYAVLEDVWYILPARAVFGKDRLAFFPNSKTSKYEEYREAWHLLREASEGEASRCRDESGAEEEAAPARPGAIHPGNPLARMQAVASYVRRRMLGGAPDAEN